MRKRIAVVAFVAGIGAAASPASAYTALYAFGDSLSDVGNLYTFTGHAIPIQPYFEGRFSNGLNWLDYFSARVGFSVSPSFTGGNDFAVGGAETGPTSVNTAASKIPFFDFDQQVQEFKILDGSRAGGALYTLDIGANDIGAALDAYRSNTMELSAFLGQAVSNTVKGIDDLFNDGARDLLYYQVPDLSLVPAFEKYGPLAGSLAQEFNTDVLAGIKSKEAEGLTVFDVPVFNDLKAIVSDPGKYGFANVTSACFSGSYDTPGTECGNPNQYLFWDTEHPTAAADALVADVAFDVLHGQSGDLAAPEPATWVMLLMGLAGLVVVRRHGVSLRRMALAPVKARKSP